jgi:hypothetical protein
MKLLAHGAARRASPSSGQGKRPEACAACQAAVAILLRKPVNNGEFRAFVDGVGGRVWVEQAMRSFENAELRSALEKGLAGIKSS